MHIHKVYMRVCLGVGVQSLKMDTEVNKFPSESGFTFTRKVTQPTYSPLNLPDLFPCLCQKKSYTITATVTLASGSFQLHPLSAGISVFRESSLIKTTFKSYSLAAYRRLKLSFLLWLAWTLISVCPQAFCLSGPCLQPWAPAHLVHGLYLLSLSLSAWHPRAGHSSEWNAHFIIPDGKALGVLTHLLCNSAPKVSHSQCTALISCAHGSTALCGVLGTNERSQQGPPSSCNLICECRGGGYLWSSGEEMSR